MFMKYYHFLNGEVEATMNPQPLACPALFCARGLGGRTQKNLGTKVAAE